MQFAFKRVSLTDLPFIQGWLLQPHVAQCFGHPNEWLEEILTNLDAEWVWHFRADLAGIPTGFAQCYDTVKAPKRA